MNLSARAAFGGFCALIVVAGVVAYRVVLRPPSASVSKDAPTNPGDEVGSRGSQAGLPNADGRATSPFNSALAARVAALDERLRVVEGQAPGIGASEQPGRIASGSASAAAADQAVPPSPSEIRSRNKALDQRLAKAVASEVTDAAWARETAARLEERLANGKVHGTTLVEGPTCWGTVCRARARHVDARARDEFEELVATDTMGSMTIPLNWPPPADGASPETVAYFVRKGYDGPGNPIRSELEAPPGGGNPTSPE